jgi:hypothetical protein
MTSPLRLRRTTVIAVLAALLTGVMVVSATVAAAEPEPPIPYKQLDWSDFRGPAPDPLPVKDGVELKSEAVVGIGLSPWGFGAGGGLPTATAEFDPNASWVSDEPADRTPELLDHEQGHFDIAEIHVRKLQAEIDKLQKEFDGVKNQKDADKLVEKINKLEKKYRALESAEQDKYENETKHGTDPKAQAKWRKKLDKQLAGK